MGKLFALVVVVLALGAIALWLKSKVKISLAKSKPVKNLNELEYIRGEIYANVWETDRIARISPRTGKVIGWIDLSGIMDKSKLTDPDAVLNGIAFDAKSGRLFVTGKLWPKLFEIRVISRASGQKKP